MKKLISLIIDVETKMDICSKYFNELEEVYAYSGELCINLEHKKQVICLSNKITLFDLEHTVLDNFKKVLHNELPISLNTNDLALEFNNYWFHVSQNDDSSLKKQLKILNYFNVAAYNSLDFFRNLK